MPAHVVLGAQWGDEGKGKVVDFLARRYDVVARFQGGNNAGHTVIVGQDTFKLHLVPSGVVAGKPVAIGNGVVVDPATLLEEMDGLAKRGVDVDLTLSPRAHVIMPYHVTLDGVSEDASKAPVGTTRRGIGPCYTDKVARLGVRVGDLVDAARLRARLQAVWPAKRRELVGWGIARPPTVASLVKKMAPLGTRLAPFVGDVGQILDDALVGGRRVLLEGAQGILLDIDHGTYPFVTSSSATAGNASAGVGIGAHRIVAVLGVAKAYTTRVGEGPFPSELASGRGVGRHLVKIGQEVGTTTGRPRRVGWLDAVALRYAVRTAGLTHLAVTKLDVLEGLDDVKIATSYKVGQRRLDSFPEDAATLDAVRPGYVRLAGWSNTRSAGGRLTRPAADFVRRVEREVGIPVVLVSAGPARDATYGLAPNPFGVRRTA